MEQGREQELRASWTVGQALVVIVLINVLELAGSYLLPFVFSNSSNLLFWSIGDTLLNTCVVLAFVKFYAQGHFITLGLVTDKLWKHIVFGLFAGLGIAGLVYLTGSILEVFVGYNPQVQSVQELAANSLNLRQQVLFLIAISLLIPLKEEVVFRGFLYPAFREKYGLVWGMIWTTLLFSLAHGSILRAIPLFIGGLALNLVYQKSGSLYPAITAHAVWNGIMGILVFWR